MSSYRYRPLVAVYLVLTTITCMYACVGEAAGPLYVVAAEAALLRDYPSPDSGILTRLQHLDQVEYLDSNAYGWWKVRSIRTGVVGWMTSDLLSTIPPSPPPSSPTNPEYYYVNAPRLNLRSIPLESSTVTGTVQLNDRLEKLGSSPNGWTKVRAPRNGKKGWLPTRYLSSHIVPCPQVSPAKKRVKRAISYNKKKNVEKQAPVNIEKQAPVEEKAKPM